MSEQEIKEARETAKAIGGSKVIRYFIKHVYGNPCFYFLDSADELAFRRLTKRVTLQLSDMTDLTQLCGDWLRFQQVPIPEERY